MVELVYNGPPMLVYSDPPLGSLEPEQRVAVDEDQVARLLATGHFTHAEPESPAEPATKIAKPTVTKAPPQED